MPKDVILTPEGLEKLKDELEDSQTTKRREVAERIKEAREFGDISENSEYDDAKNEQAMLEARIAAARGEAALGDGHRRQGRCRPTSSASARSSTSRTRRRQVARSSRSSARPRPTPPEQALQRVAGRQGAASGHRKRDEVVEVALPSGSKRKLKITKIDVGL